MTIKVPLFQSQYEAPKNRCWKQAHPPLCCFSLVGFINTHSELINYEGGKKVPPEMWRQGRFLDEEFRAAAVR